MPKIPNLTWIIALRNENNMSLDVVRKQEEDSMIEDFRHWVSITVPISSESISSITKGLTRKLTSIVPKPQPSILSQLK